MEKQCKTKHLDSDPRNNIIPTSPEGYFVRAFLFGELPPGYDASTLRRETARQAFESGLTLKQFEDTFYEKQKTIVETYRAAHASGKAEEHEKLFSMSPEQADAKIREILSNPNHPIHHDIPTEHHARAVSELEELHMIRGGLSDDWGNCIPRHHKGLKEGFKTFGDVTSEKGSRSSRSYDDVDKPAKEVNGSPDPGVGFGSKQTKSGHGDVMEPGKSTPSDYVYTPKENDGPIY